MFYTETQDGSQKLQENNFLEKLPDDSADTLGIKNYANIALPCTISEVNSFLHFMQKFKMAVKNGLCIQLRHSLGLSPDKPVVQVLMKSDSPGNGHKLHL